MIKKKIEKNDYHESEEDMNIEVLISTKFNININTIKLIGEGLDSKAYLVNDEYIFKKSKHREAAENMKKEIQVLNYLDGKLSLKIPKIEFYDEENSLCGYKQIKGQILNPGMFQAMTKEEQDELAEDIAQFLEELHSVPLPNINGLEINVSEDYQNDYTALKERVYDKLPMNSKKYLESLFEKILNDDRITNYKKVLCHNDMSCKHIVIENNVAVGVIDFGDVAITDRDKDFVYLLEDSSEEIGRKFGLKVLEYYNHPNRDIAILKADLNKEYYPIEQILGGESKGLEDLYNRGLNTIKNKKV